MSETENSGEKEGEFIQASAFVALPTFAQILMTAPVEDGDIAERQSMTLGANSMDFDKDFS